ncbi:thiamine biosynthesis protein ThiS [Anaerovirgula multivorans]|uniref:Thiamine biosynthesis protein ThiS n=1 Tax=Anaerovirgula multivorans TaxID=312168 RepID=A0A239GD25_9FIRM|nr:sulfur carrier protein ThiS [Anaerovirgula multivorans]SNS65954.1 thiamine biosynthesis protein ThiS [Anaerovirgula multivorans]
MIKVNGRDAEWEEDLTVEKLLEKNKYTFPKIYVKINDELVPQHEYAIRIIMDEDDIKVIHLMAGG